MVDIAPFRALRPSLGKKFGDISKFICPPYDVISPDERQTLVKKSPQNVVQLELPAGEGEDKYGNASNLMRLWKTQGVVQEDRQPSFYLLETTYKIADAFAPKSSLKRYGVLAALRLETPGKGAVRPHEKTLPKAKEDRLKLLMSVRTNVSPIFGLFFDDKKQWKKWVGALVKKKPLVTGREHAQLSHRMWKIDDAAVQKKLSDVLRGKELFIADGHHRYEVAWAYKDSRLKEAQSAAREEGWNSVMAYICPMEEKGLLMLPTHRLVKLPISSDALSRHLANFFDTKPVPHMNAIVKALAKPSKDRVIGFIAKGRHYLLSLRKDISIERCLEHRPKALRELDVVLLHDLALGEAPGLELAKDREIIYTRDLKEMAGRVKSDPAWVGFLLASPGVGSLARVASAGEVMPPKTTYFYPKVPTGFTMMPLDQKIG